VIRALIAQKEGGITNMEVKPQPLLWLTDARGIFIPRDFATCFSEDNREKFVKGVQPEDWKILEEGPDSQQYWEVWEEVERDAIVNINGTEYFLNQDGDLWLVPVGMEFSEKYQFWVWPDGNLVNK